MIVSASLLTSSQIKPEPPCWRCKTQRAPPILHLTRSCQARHVMSSLSGKTCNVFLAREQGACESSGHVPNLD